MSIGKKNTEQRRKHYASILFYTIIVLNNYIQKPCAQCFSQLGHLSQQQIIWTASHSEV